ncbi:hypothetical protein O9X98_06850 [Agrobacterium salinitolerans]|nr:hypothetical protein [Agrobacterium salinitolerans]
MSSFLSRARERLNNRMIETRKKHLIDAGADPAAVDSAVALARSSKDDKTLENMFNQYFDPRRAARQARREAAEKAPPTKFQLKLRISLSEDRSFAARGRRLAQLDAIADANLVADIKASAGPQSPRPR